MLVLAPFAGVWVDRWNRRKLLIVTQTLAMMQSFTLALVAYTFPRVPLIVALFPSHTLTSTSVLPTVSG